MKSKQLRPGLELKLLVPFPTIITITLCVPQVAEKTSVLVCGTPPPSTQEWTDPSPWRNQAKASKGHSNWILYTVFPYFYIYSKNKYLLSHATRPLT